MEKIKLQNFYKDYPVLVTGGAGFIGSHLAEKLVSLNAIVTIVDNLSTGSLENIKDFKNLINFIHADIIDFDVCKEITKNQKIIFHLAAATSVSESMQHPEKYNKVNVQGTFNILEAAKINCVERFIFSSSSAVYGIRNDACKEDDVCNPISFYSYSKLIGEQYCRFYSSNSDLKTICLRYFNVYGPKQNPNGEYAGVIAKFTELIKKNEPITVYGDGTQSRDFINVKDVVEANIYLAMLDNNQLNGQPINIATGKSTTLLELISNLKKQFPNYTNETRFVPARKCDINFSVADITKYRNLYLQTFE